MKVKWSMSDFKVNDSHLRPSESVSDLNQNIKNALDLKLLLQGSQRQCEEFTEA